MLTKKNMQTLPNSFFIEPISNNKLHFQKGDCLEFNIIFIGVNIGYIPLFIHALEIVADNGLGVQRKSFMIMDIEDCTTHKKVYSDRLYCNREWELDYKAFLEEARTVPSGLANIHMKFIDTK